MSMMPTGQFPWMPQQGGGLLGGFADRAMSNPLTHLGIGLLNANAPRYSTNIADLNGTGIGPGLMQGVQSYDQYRRGTGNLALRSAALKESQQRGLLAQQKYEAEQQEAQRKAAAREQIAGLLAGGASKEQIAPMLAQAGLLSEATSMAFPEPPSVAQEYEYAQKNPGLLDYVTAKARAGATNVTQIAGGQGGLSVRPLLPSEHNLVPQGTNPDDYVVDLKKGTVVSKPSPPKPTESEARAGQLVADMEEASRNLIEYEADANSAEPWVPGYIEYAMPAAGGLQNFFASPEYKKYRDNAMRWAGATGYLISGATVRQEEKEDMVREYFRMPGDEPEQIRQKIAARRIRTEQARAKARQFAPSRSGLLSPDSKLRNQGAHPSQILDGPPPGARLIQRGQ